MIKSNNTASVSSLCCTNTRHFPEAPLLPEQEGSAGNYAPDELRNAEEMLADLDEVYYSLIKLQREYGALVRASGPDGYVCHSAECSRSAQSLNMSALELAQRLECLSGRYHALVCMLRTLKEDLASLRPGREYTFLKLRFRHGLSVDEAAQQLRCSRRSCYRIRMRALNAVCDSLSKTPLGRRVLSFGHGTVLHRYNK